MHQEERLAGDEPVAAVADLAEPQFGDAGAGAGGVGAAAPVGDAIGAADGVRTEAGDGAGGGRRSRAEIVGGEIRRQSDCRFRSDGWGAAEGDDDDD